MSRRIFIFDNAKDIHSYELWEKYEESGFGLDKNLPTISYQSCLPYSMEIGLVKRINLVKPTYLTIYGS